MIDASSIRDVIFPSICAGVIAVIASVIVEKFGGRKGGAIATIPSTVIPATLGFYEVDQGVGFLKAMAVIPVGMLVSAGFLALWRILPKRLHAFTSTSRLIVTSIVSVAAWLLFAAIVAEIQRRVDPSPGGAIVWGVCAILTTLMLGLFLLREKVDAPRGKRKVSPLQLFLRGLASSIAICIALMIAKSGMPVIGGLVSAFPAIFLTTMVGTWISQGDEVPVGAVAPMVMGATSVGLFALMTIWLFPLLGPILGLIAAWILAVSFVTVPLMYSMRSARG